MAHFYSHIIKTDIIHEALDGVEIEGHERIELLQIAESGVHHVVIDTILSELSEEDKKKFLEHLSQEDHENIWGLLKEKVEGAEDKISKAAHSFLEKLHHDVKKIR